MSKENEKLQEAIEKAINDNLPKAQGTLLQKRLSEADDFEEEISDLKETIEEHGFYEKELNKEINDLESRLEKLETKIEKDKDLVKQNKATKKANDEWVKSLQLQQQGLDLQLVQQELQLVRESKEEIKALTDRVFRNHTIRETVMKNITGSVSTTYNAQGMCETQNNGDQNGTITTTKTSEDEGGE